MQSSLSLLQPAMLGDTGKNDDMFFFLRETGLQDASVFRMEHGDVTQKRTAFISVKKKKWFKKVLQSEQILGNLAIPMKG